MGEPMFAYRRWPGTDLVFFYAFGMPDDRERNEAGVRRIVQRHGGSVERVELSRPWRYFPHVSSADLGAGFQERLEALQGQQRTFYTGEIFSFSMVEAVVAHARKIVDRHFAPPGARPVHQARTRSRRWRRRQARSCPAPFQLLPHRPSR
jgi:hypothetical protein